MGRRYYSREFKLELLKKVKDGGPSMAEIARAHGVGESLLRRWKQEFGAEVGFLPHMPPGASGPEAELESLRRENARLREESDILKKAAAWLAEHKP